MSIVTSTLHGAKVCLIPMPANDDRPLTLRHRPLAALSALLIVAKVLAATVIALTPASADLSTITSARIVQLANAERTKAGLHALQTNSQLTNAAVQKGNHMLEEDYFAHISPSGVTPWFWMSKVGYTYQVAGENLAIDFIEAEDVVAAWLASPSHRDNMLHDQYTETGVGVVTGEFQGGTSTIVVHMFGLPSGQSAPPAATPAPTVKADTTKAASPTPTPTPRPTTTPTPVPVTPAPPSPGDTTPPRVPRIATLDGDTVAATVRLEIEGEPLSTVHVSIQNQAQDNVVIPADGTTVHTLSLSSFPDSTLVIRAYATDAAGNSSKPSESLALAKDTQSPRLAREDVAFVLAPTTDDSRMLVVVANTDAQRLVVDTNGTPTPYSLADPVVISAMSPPFELALHDSVGNQTTVPNIDIRPQFDSAENTESLAPPARFSQLTRRLTASIFATILILLVLAILIRIRIQRPVLIAHASFVLLIAGLLFFW